MMYLDRGKLSRKMGAKKGREGKWGRSPIYVREEFRDFEIGRILHLKSRNPKSQIELCPTSQCLPVQFEILDFGI
jgi:hypothetical protein